MWFLNYWFPNVSPIFKWPSAPMLFDVTMKSPNGKLRLIPRSAAAVNAAAASRDYKATESCYELLHKARHAEWGSEATQPGGCDSTTPIKPMNLFHVVDVCCLLFGVFRKKQHGDSTEEVILHGSGLRAPWSGLPSYRLPHHHRC